jgi:acetyl esterase/lipase
MFSLKPDKDISVKKVKAQAPGHAIPALVLMPKQPRSGAPGILWIHGGGYFLGMKEMVHMSRAVDLVKKYGAVVVSPGYTLAFWKPYPAAINDCYAALLYVKEHAGELGINPNQIMVGGESAGGGLCAALCIMARDRGEVRIAYQMPLYPMLDNFDTETSRDNHGKVWNTRINHLGWRLYLRKAWRAAVSPYAAAARQTDYRNLPPAYTFVGDGEPFYQETLTYIENLKNAGVEASADVYHTDVHAFDILMPEKEISVKAAEKFNEKFAYAMKHYFSGNDISSVVSERNM